MILYAVMPAGMRVRFLKSMDTVSILWDGTPRELRYVSGSELPNEISRVSHEWQVKLERLECYEMDCPATAFSLRPGGYRLARPQKVKSCHLSRVIPATDVPHYERTLMEFPDGK